MVASRTCGGRYRERERERGVVVVVVVVVVVEGYQGLIILLSFSLLLYLSFSSRSALESSRDGITLLTITSSKRISKSLLNVLRIEAQNMHTLLRVVVAQAGVEKIERSTTGVSGIKEDRTNLTPIGLTLFQYLVMSMLIAALLAVAAWHYYQMQGGGERMSL